MPKVRCGATKIAPENVYCSVDTALFHSMLETPVGAIQLSVNDEGALVEILLPNRKPAASSPKPLSTSAERGMLAVKQQVSEYFLRKRRVFDLPLLPEGSPFEQQVWTTLLAIPYGKTTSYGAIAAELGLTNGARAVGRANGANPIPIVIPCHRVIGSGGQLTGYGGGLPLKHALLELEGAVPPPEPRLL
jgi:methylated-DNA-[protein]-cysteine S-methyltransferase